MTAHTPLPWKRGGVFRAGTGWAEYIIGPCTSHDPTRIVCGLEDARMGKEMMEATAEFIVCACNAHADLVAALEGIHNFWVNGQRCWCPVEPESDDPVSAHATCHDARAALAKARGETA